jgi:molecular chaperone GrpE
MNQHAKPQSRPLTGDPPENPAVQSQASSPALDDMESLRNRLQDAEHQRDEYLALLQRTRADFENYQKRNQRDLAEERRYAHAPFARELLPVLDSLQRALELSRQENEDGSLIRGLMVAQSQLSDVLKRFGITSIDPVGERFDPNLHEAMLQEPSTTAAPGTVIRVLEPGYRLHERVLRPAKVVVAKAAMS